MQVSLSSGNYDIIASGEAILFSPSNELTINVNGENELKLCVTLRFLTDESGERRIEREIEEERLILLNYNFSGTGTGLSVPAYIANINNHKVYLSFWSYLEGSNSPKVRSVKYTLFLEK